MRSIIEMFRERKVILNGVNYQCVHKDKQLSLIKYVSVFREINSHSYLGPFPIRSIIEMFRGKNGRLYKARHQDVQREKQPLL